MTAATDAIPNASPGELLVASGAQILQAENAEMRSISQLRPRDPQKVHDAALEELARVPHLAEKFYYELTFGTDVQRGLSIEAARMLMRLWGNCSVKSLVTGEDEERVYVVGMFLDLETNARFERPLIVSKWYISRDSGAKVWLEGPRLITAIQAGVSKAERNAITEGIPLWIRRGLYDKALLTAGQAAEKDRGKLLAWLHAHYGVTGEQIVKKIGRPMEKFTLEEWGRVKGWSNALHDGEATVAQLFGNGEAEKAPPSATVAEILKSGAKVTGGAESDAARAKAESRNGDRPAEPPESPAAAKTAPRSEGSKPPAAQRLMF